MDRWRTVGARLALMLLFVMLPACAPPVCSDGSGPIDGPSICDAHWTRDEYNVCPEQPPTLGLDENGVTWLPDLFLGLLPNPFHWPLQCFRGISVELGLSSYQCCYDGDVLVTDSPLAGSFDFVFPYRNTFTLLWHYVLDILPLLECEQPPSS
ncbi:MAG: hypothetical protein JXA69_14625 [Phycisphaerae bacterium]|nr:hypothetical protein [Phycisphaerae bacterium]